MAQNEISIATIQRLPIYLDYLKSMTGDSEYISATSLASALGFGEVQVRKVNLESAIAWRYNAFSFEETPLEEIMNELARWYNIHVFYLNPKVKELHFTAWFRRNCTLQEVIDILEKTGKINIELKGKTITVTQKQ